ncbi:MAG: hypothetical protein FOGNACKC_01296 [Anaerolineae bacterium]|nr:hypothetical protein [Anaerolineae bacterium]
MSVVGILTTLTLIAVVAVVIVLVVYLLLIIAALRRAGDNLAQLAGGLQTVVDNTQPLGNHLTTINSALSELDGGLQAVDSNLVGVAQVLKLTD